MLDRRDFLTRASTLIAATALLPACGGSTTDTDTDAFDTDSDSSGGGAEVNDAWETQASDLELAGVFTAANPGEWAGKEGSHAPSATATGMDITLITEHGMEADHWIDVVYLRDQDDIVVGLLEFVGTDAAAEATFTLPEGTTEVTPFSHCNLHGLWMGDVISV